MGFKTRSCLSPKKVGWTGDGRKERGRPLTTSSPLMAAASVFVPRTDPASWGTQSPLSAGFPRLCAAPPVFPQIFVLTGITWWPKRAEFFICGLAKSVVVSKMRRPCICHSQHGFLSGLQ